MPVPLRLARRVAAGPVDLDVRLPRRLWLVRITWIASRRRCAFGIPNSAQGRTASRRILPECGGTCRGPGSSCGVPGLENPHRRRRVLSRREEVDFVKPVARNRAGRTGRRAGVNPERQAVGLARAAGPWRPAHGGRPSPRPRNRAPCRRGRTGRWRGGGRGRRLVPFDNCSRRPRRIGTARRAARAPDFPAGAAKAA